MSDTEVLDEIWEEIPEFPDYQISSFGRVFHTSTGKYMTPSPMMSGHLKVSFTRERITRSVALLVAEAFIEPPDARSNCVVIKNGDLSNVAAYNLCWRPRYFSWLYRRQFPVEEQPLHFKNLRVRNLNLHVDYPCVVDCGIAEGVLFQDIWDSTYLGRLPYPFHHKYKITERV